MSSQDPPNYLSTVMERLYIQKLPELQTEEGMLITSLNASFNCSLVKHIPPIRFTLRVKVHC